MAVSRHAERINWDGYLVLRRTRQSGTSTLQVPIGGDEEWRALIDYLKQRPWKVLDHLDNVRVRDEFIYWRLIEHSNNSYVIRAFTRSLDITIYIDWHEEGNAEIRLDVTRPTVSVIHQNPCTEV